MREEREGSPSGEEEASPAKRLEPLEGIRQRSRKQRLAGGFASVGFFGIRGPEVPHSFFLWGAVRDGAARLPGRAG